MTIETGVGQWGSPKVTNQIFMPLGSACHRLFENIERRITRLTTDLGNTMSSSNQADTAELSKGLIGYAVLRANFNHSTQSYIENFTSFVLDVLAQAHPQFLREHEIAERVRSTFGLTMPDRVVGELLKRSVQRGLVVPRQDRFSLTDDAIGALPDLTGEIVNFGRQQKELLTKFAAFVERESPQHADEFTTADLARHLQIFVETNTVPLLAKAIRPGTQAPWEGRDLGADAPTYLVAAFLESLYSSDLVAFNYVVDSVKGAMLAAVLELDTGNLAQKLGRLHLMLDTPVILKALGYQGEAQREAMRQLLDLAFKLNARLECFEHTAREVDGVLESAGAALRSRGRAQGKLREVDAYFLDAGLGPADVEIRRAHLDEDLRKLRVSVVAAGGDYYRFGLDEAELDQILQSGVGYKSDSTRRYDVDSLSAVHRLREGSSPADFAQCRYVLITDNSALTRASKRVRERQHRWPLAMLDSELATLLWVRSPAVADDLPRQQLLATAYAGLQPNAHLWSKYLGEVESLQASGGVSDEEAMILRARPEARRALMDETLGDDSEVSSEVILRVVDKIKSEIAAPFEEMTAAAIAERDAADAKARADKTARLKTEEQLTRSESRVDSLSGRLVEVEGSLDDLRGRDRARDQKLRERAATRARTIVFGSISILATLLVLAAAFDFAKPKWLSHAPTWIGFLLLVLGIALVGLTAIRLVFGGSVREWFRPLESKLAKRLERKFRLRAGLDGPAEKDSEDEQQN